LASNTPTITRLILFDFLSKISIRNSLIFYFKIEILILQQSLFILALKIKNANMLIIWYNIKEVILIMEENIKYEKLF